MVYLQKSFFNQNFSSFLVVFCLMKIFGHFWSCFIADTKPTKKNANLGGGGGVGSSRILPLKEEKKNWEEQSRFSKTERKTVSKSLGKGRLILPSSLLKTELNIFKTATLCKTETKGDVRRFQSAVMTDYDLIMIDHDSSWPIMLNHDRSWSNHGQSW